MGNHAAEYQVVVSGEVLDGHDTGAVVDAFASLLKLEPDAAQGYFTGTPRIIKQRTDHATACRIQNAFRRIGVDSSIVPLRGNAHTAPVLRLVGDSAPGGAQAAEPVEEVFAEPVEKPRGLNPKILALAGAFALLGLLAWVGAANLA